MNKEEAHLVARITAYRLARHFGRTEVQVQHVYDLDPRLYITRFAQHLLTHDAQGRPKRVETRPDAHDRYLDIASSLVLAHLVDANDTDSAPDPTEVDRLARQELELTLSLLMADDFGSYADFNPSEARAADDLQVPFSVALHLGEIGLLKDPPGPTESRLQRLSDALRRQQDV